ncbi:MAG: class I SAM-dependent methyltransferase [Bdellovibrionales bacterium]
MEYSPAEAQISLKIVEDLLKNNDPPPLRLKRLVWTLMCIRARGLANGLRLLTGDKVYAGPFKDMVLTNDALAAYQAPILLGCYEHELHSVFEDVIANDYARVLNIGCSVGYYAVGLARRMPHVVVEAFDISDEARRKCLDMARANNVEDRVHVSGQFYGEDYAKYADKKTLVIMDIESAEKDLLNPEAFPALRKMDVIVELHDLMDPTISKTICARFEASHDIEIIRNQTSLPDVEKLLPEGAYVDPYDHMLLGWECRDGKTPWGLFRVKNQ